MAREKSSPDYKIEGLTIAINDMTKTKNKDFKKRVISQI